jgi:hypothetical protein
VCAAAPRPGTEQRAPTARRAAILKRHLGFPVIFASILLATASCGSTRSQASAVTIKSKPFVTKDELLRGFATHAVPIVLDFDYAQFDKHFPELASFTAKDPRIGTKLKVLQCRNAALARLVARNFSRIFSQTKDRAVLTRLNVVVVLDPRLRDPVRTRIRAAVRSLT